jgi:hypothetical protein
MRWACVSALAGAIAFVPVASSAQSFDDAVWANASLALQLCIAGTAPGEVRAQWFRNAGFTETVMRTPGNSDTTHTFTAPSDTVSVELYYGEMPEHCIVSSAHMGVARAGALLDALIPQIFPGYARSPIDGDGAQCVRYIDPTNPIGHVVGVISMSTQTCAENGTVQFYSSYRV